MSTCPECGGQSQAITENADTGETYAECENGHTWVDESPDN